MKRFFLVIVLAILTMAAIAQEPYKAYCEIVGTGNIIYILLGVFVFYIIVKCAGKDVRNAQERERRNRAYEEKKIVEDLKAYKEKQLDEYLKVGYSFTIKGIYYRTENEIKRAQQIKMNDSLFLEFEPDNIYDSNAIKVLTEDKIHIGYVPSKSCETVKLLIERSSGYDISVYVKIDSEDGIPYILAKIDFKMSD